MNVVSDVSRLVPTPTVHRHTVTSPCRYQRLNRTRCTDHVRLGVQYQGRGPEWVLAERPLRLDVVGGHLTLEHASVRLKGGPDSDLHRSKTTQSHADTAWNSFEVDRTVKDLTANPSGHGRGKIGVRYDVVERLSVEVAADREAMNEYRLKMMSSRREEREDLRHNGVGVWRPQDLTGVHFDMEHIKTLRCSVHTDTM